MAYQIRRREKLLPVFLSNCDRNLVAGYRYREDWLRVGCGARDHRSGLHIECRPVAGTLQLGSGQCALIEFAAHMSTDVAHGVISTVYVSDENLFPIFSRAVIFPAGTSFADTTVDTISLLSPPQTIVIISSALSSRPRCGNPGHEAILSPD